MNLIMMMTMYDDDDHNNNNTSTVRIQFNKLFIKQTLKSNWISMYFPNLLELSFLLVFALPNACINKERSFIIHKLKSGKVKTYAEGKDSRCEQRERKKVGGWDEGLINVPWPDL